MSSAEKEATYRVAFLINSCDAYSDLWEPFFTYFFKNWAHCQFDIYLIANFKTYSHPRVTVINVGEDVSYADNLRAALGLIDADWILLWFDDAFICQHVDDDRLLKILCDAEESNSPFIQLSPDLPVSYEHPNGDIGIVPHGVKYRTAVGVNFIKKDLLLQLVPPGISAWEMDRSDMSDRLSIDVYALTRDAATAPPIESIHAVAKGRWIRSAYPILKNDGWDDLLKGRGIQPFWEHIYFRLYHLRGQIYKALSIYWR